MNKKIPFVPNETDAILYVIISVLLLMSVNQVLSHPQMLRDVNRIEDTYSASFGRATQNEFGLAGNCIIFSADQYLVGYEPHSFNINQVATALCYATLSANAFGDAEVFATSESFICQVRTPFGNDFSGKENENAQPEIYTIADTVESIRDVSCNVDYHLGNSWRT